MRKNTMILARIMVKTSSNISLVKPSTFSSVGLDCYKNCPFNPSKAAPSKKYLSLIIIDPNLPQNHQLKRLPKARSLKGKQALRVI
jgi:hypothetical protein